MSKKKNNIVEENVEEVVTETTENTEEVNETVEETIEETVTEKPVVEPVEETSVKKSTVEVAPVNKPVVEVSGNFYVTLGKVPEHRLENVKSRIYRLGVTPIIKNNGEILIGPYDTKVNALVIRKMAVANGLVCRVVEK